MIPAGGDTMAWDFSTEPEFQRELDWMERFVREEIGPIDLLFEEPYNPGDLRTGGEHRPALEPSG